MVHIRYGTWKLKFRSIHINAIEYRDVRKKCCWKTLLSPNSMYTFPGPETGGASHIEPRKRYEVYEWNEATKAYVYGNFAPGWFYAAIIGNKPMGVGAPDPNTKIPKPYNPLGSKYLRSVSCHWHHLHTLEWSLQNTNFCFWCLSLDISWKYLYFFFRV